MTDARLPPHVFPLGNCPHCGSVLVYDARRERVGHPKPMCDWFRLRQAAARYSRETQSVEIGGFVLHLPRVPSD